MRYKLFLVLIFLGFSNKSYSMGIGDWIYHTSNGSVLEDPGGGIRLYTNNAELIGLKKWYFYKDYIIGEYRIYPSQNIEYFIADEITGEILIYKDKENWEKVLDLKELHPRIWVNWHTSHFSLYYLIIILMLFNKLISLGLMILLGWVIYKSIFKEKFRLIKPYTIILIIVILLISIVIVEDKFVVSI